MAGMHSETTRRHWNSVFRFALLLLLWGMLTPVTFSAPGDLVIPRKEGADMSVEVTPASTFPHWLHRVRYRCDACHDTLFKMKLGATEISKALMKEKQSCAVCHNGEVAFEVGLNTCNRCHRTVEE